MDGHTADSVSKMSKEAEALRSFVSQRLAAASLEILAVVDRVVAGYEEEASGLRQQITGQRRRLELLRPQTVRTPGVKRSRGEEEEEDEDDEESDQCVGDRRRPAGRHQISESQSSIDLKIRILEDPQTNVLTKQVLKTCPILKLTCPRGLQESDFLDLLKSTFPQLTGDKKTFDVLMSDKRQRLRPLKLKTLTAEDVHRISSSSTGGAKSIVYIRPKREEEPAVQTQTSPDELTSEESRRQIHSCQEVEESQPDEDVEAEETPDVHSAAEGERSDADEKDKEDSQRPQICEVKKSVSRLQSKRQRVTCSGFTQTKTEDTQTHTEAEDTSGVHDGTNPEDDGGSGPSTETQKELRHRSDDCPVCEASCCGVLGERRETPHKCSICPSAFALKASLEKHQKQHEAAQPYKCCTCHKVFENKEQLKAHSRTHVSRKTHLCGVCGKSLSDYRSLMRHKMTHSGERPHSCEVCGRRFKLPGTLRQHEKIHTDRERSYLCEICCKMFLTSQQLQIHLRRHSDEKPYVCGECGKGFTTKGPLTIHMRVHTGETPYRCPDCGWSFKRKTNLDNHVAVHSGVKPFVCGICGKACARKTHLTVHMRTHNGERPYKCSLCDKAFTQSHCLKTHMKSHQAAGSPT